MKNLSPLVFALAATACQPEPPQLVCGSLDLLDHEIGEAPQLLLGFSLDWITTSEQVNAVLADKTFVFGIQRAETDTFDCFARRDFYDGAYWASLPYDPSLAGEWAVKLILPEDVTDAVYDNIDLKPGEEPNCLAATGQEDNGAVPKGNVFWAYLADHESTPNYTALDITAEDCLPTFQIP